MNTYTKTALLSMALIMGASANDGSKRTVVKFSAPVEAPGVILPAGYYVFRVAADDENRNFVEIFNKDEGRAAGDTFHGPRLPFQHYRRGRNDVRTESRRRPQRAPSVLLSRGDGGHRIRI